MNADYHRTADGKTLISSLFASVAVRGDERLVCRRRPFEGVMHNGHEANAVPGTKEDCGGHLEVLTWAQD